MSKPENSYRLVVFEVPDDPAAVRDLLCGVTGIHPADAMLWVAKAPGVWPRPLAEGEVRELLDGLYNLGVAAEAWRVDLMPVIFPPRNVRDAACLPEGFRVKGLRGEPTHWVPWDKVELISAGRIQADDEFRNVVPPSWTTSLVTGLNAMIRRPTPSDRRARARRVPRDAVGEVILVRREPRIAFRIVETEMKYSYLEDRLRPSAGENFPLFVADLRARADKAFVTDSTLALLGVGDEGEDGCRFSSTQALLDYTMHRLLWGWYRRDRDRGLENGDPDATQG